MRRILIVSPHRPSRELFARILRQSDVSAVGVQGADEALTALHWSMPSLVIIDSRREAEDHPLLLGLLRRRHPDLAIISLLPGCVRVLVRTRELVYDARGSGPDDLAPLLTRLQEATEDILTEGLLSSLRTPLARS